MYGGRDEERECMEGEMRRGSVWRERGEGVYGGRDEEREREIKDEVKLWRSGGK